MIHSFPTTDNTRGVDVFEMSQIKDFVQKIGPRPDILFPDNMGKNFPNELTSYQGPFAQCDSDDI